MAVGESGGDYAQLGQIVGTGEDPLLKNRGRGKKNKRKRRGLTARAPARSGRLAGPVPAGYSGAGIRPLGFGLARQAYVS